jgi:hypothetical protein
MWEVKSMSEDRALSEIISRLKSENNALKDRVKYSEGQLSGMRLSEHIKHFERAEVSIPVKKKNKRQPQQKYSELDMALAIRIKDGVYNVSGNMMRKPNMTSWANAIRVMRTADHIKCSDIENVFNWANTDIFWKTVVLSPLSLRRNWDKIVARMGNNTVDKEQERSDKNMEYIEEVMNR